MTNLENFKLSVTNHSPSEDQIKRIELVREKIKELGEVLFTNCPQSRERSIAITELETCTMWATKSIVLENK